LVTLCIGTAFLNTLLKEGCKESWKAWKNEEEDAYSYLTTFKITNFWQWQ
jgi:hypothetical protein